jgi:hypothetical protein
MLSVGLPVGKPPSLDAALTNFDVSDLRWGGQSGWQQSSRCRDDNGRPADLLSDRVKAPMSNPPVVRWPARTGWPPHEEPRNDGPRNNGTRNNGTRNDGPGNDGRETTGPERRAQKDGPRNDAPRNKRPSLKRSRQDRPKRGRPKQGGVPAGARCFWKKRPRTQNLPEPPRCQRGGFWAR